MSTPRISWKSGDLLNELFRAAYALGIRKATWSAEFETALFAVHQHIAALESRSTDTMESDVASSFARSHISESGK